MTRRKSKKSDESLSQAVTSNHSSTVSAKDGRVKKRRRRGKKPHDHAACPSKKKPTSYHSVPTLTPWLKPPQPHVPIPSPNCFYPPPPPVQDIIPAPHICFYPPPLPFHTPPVLYNSPPLVNYVPPPQPYMYSRTPFYPPPLLHCPSSRSPAKPYHAQPPFTAATQLSHLSPHQQKVVAVDCEMVGVLSDTSTKLASALGRCSIVQYDGKVIFDEYVLPEKRIIDYRTRWSGIRKSDMRHAMSFQDALWIIHGILQDKIIVGHAIHNDLDVLKYSHPETDIRDTSLYVPVRVLAELPPDSIPSLKKLSAGLLQRTIQTGSHCSVIDARATLDVYKVVEKRWEEEAPENRYVFRKSKKSKAGGKRAKRNRLFNDRYWSDKAVEYAQSHIQTST